MILTDVDIATIAVDIGCSERCFEEFARAIEAAVMAKLEGGREPIAWFDEEMQSAYTRAELDGCAIDGLVPLYALQNSAQRPLSEIQITEIIQKKHYRKGHVLRNSDLMCIEWYKLGIKDCEAAHHIKEKP